MERLKTLVIALAPPIIFGMLLGIYPGYMVYKYVWKDARFCTTCHVHDYATVGWSKSIHGQMTTCHDCHHQPLRAYMIEALTMVKKPPRFPADLDHTPYVKKDLCAACHLTHPHDQSTVTGPMEEEEIDKLPKVDRSYLHRVHLEKFTNLTSLNSHELTKQERSMTPEPVTELPRTEGPKRSIECSDCHGGPTNRGHNFSVVDVSCVRCHSSQHHESKALQMQGCRTCHFQDFLAPVKQDINPKAKKK